MGFGHLASIREPSRCPSNCPSGTLLPFVVWGTLFEIYMNFKKKGSSTSRSRHQESRSFVCHRPRRPVHAHSSLRPKFLLVLPAGRLLKQCGFRCRAGLGFGGFGHCKDVESCQFDGKAALGNHCSGWLKAHHKQQRESK